MLGCWGVIVDKLEEMRREKWAGSRVGPGVSLVLSVRLGVFRLWLNEKAAAWV